MAPHKLSNHHSSSRELFPVQFWTARMQGTKTRGTAQVRASRKKVRLLAVALSACVGVAHGHYDDTSPTSVHACVSKTTKVVRIIGAKASATCNSGEVARHWAVTGNSITPPYVTDSSGTYVGTFLGGGGYDEDADSYSFTLINSKNTVFHIGQNAKLIRRVEAFYDNPHCQGKPELVPGSFRAPSPGKWVTQATDNQGTVVSDDVYFWDFSVAGNEQAWGIQTTSYVGGGTETSCVYQGDEFVRLRRNDVAQTGFDEEQYKALVPPLTLRINPPGN